MEWGFPELFMVSQAVLPALLYLPGTQPLRVPIRTAPFLISLAALIWFGKKSFHFRLQAPAQKWLVLCSLCLLAMVFHPTTNSVLAGGAHAMLYLSVLAPIFWAPQLKLAPERIQRLLFIILISCGLNAVVGILQVYDPVTWMPQELSKLVTSTVGGIGNVSYIGPDGRTIIRPTGLSDNPGAVAGPATAATLLGLIFFFERTRAWKRLTALLCAVAGLTVIFLSQVRTSLLVVCGATLGYIALLVLQKQKQKALMLFAVGVVAVCISFSFALVLGGQSIEERVSTLFEDDPMTVYYSNRGAQIEYGFTTLLAQYPAGAGLGRWGMMRAYFGDENNLDSPPIWAELQPNAWILDGGLVLLLFYLLAVGANTRSEIRMMRMARSPALRFSTSAIAAVNLVTVALIFGYTPFTNQVGVQYWFLSGILYNAACDPDL
jgi:hypothetical protein